MKTTSDKPSQRIEPGYRPVLLREETKVALQQLRRTFGNRDLNQERRLITAAVELVMQSPDLHSAWLNRVSDVVLRDLASQQLEKEETAYAG